MAAAEVDENLDGENPEEAGQPPQQPRLAPKAAMEVVAASEARRDRMLQKGSEVGPKLPAFSGKVDMEAQISGR